MIIASVDIETTGLDPERCQVLEVGIVLWDTTDFKTPVEDLPYFHTYVIHDQIVGEPYALAMNATILQRIANGDPEFQYLEANEVGAFIWAWAENLGLTPNGLLKLSPAGFNFDGFDRQFLNKLPEFTDHVEFSHRSLSPGTLFFDPMIDVKFPGSDEVFRRAGVTVEDRHTALGDARGVIEVLRRFYGGGGAPAPVCPACDGGGTLRVSTDHGEWDDQRCQVCNPDPEAEGSVFPFLPNYELARQRAIAG